jgi:hypothetical protein
MTSAQFDQQLLDRISSNPNPRRPWFVRRVWDYSIVWGRKLFIFHRELNREAALDSARNVLAVLGLGTVLADFGTMRLWLLAPCAAMAWLVWFIDYQRHF